jgi:hypothetical protein
MQETHVSVEGASPEPAEPFSTPQTLSNLARPRTMPVPSRLAIQAWDWHALVTSRANTVVVAREDAVMGVWTALWPTLQKPIHWVEASSLSLPRRSAGTLILQDADALTPTAQQELFDWLERDARATRVLTTTSLPLFPLVEGGSFLAALYYRLNVLLLVL